MLITGISGYRISVFQKSKVARFSEWLPVQKAALNLPDIDALFAQLAFIITIPAYVYVIGFKDLYTEFAVDFQLIIGYTGVKRMENMS